MTKRSKKLNGNGLWESSRMILPQHREALLSMDLSPAVRAEPDRRDIELIRESIYLPLVRQLILKAVQTSGASSNLLGKCAAVSGQIMARQIQEQINETQRKLAVREIRVRRVIDGDRDTLHYTYTCRGHEGDVQLQRAEVKAEVAARAGRYREAHIRDLRGLMQNKKE